MSTPGVLFNVALARPKWGWWLSLGIVMVVLGAIALSIMPEATFGTMLVLGWLLVISGVMELIHAFQTRHAGGLMLHLAGGILGLLIGLLVVTHPLAGAVAATLLYASFLTVIGLFRLVASLSLRFPHWGWSAFDGLVTLVLGILVWVSWPSSGLWFIGLAVGISLVMRGWAYVMAAFALRTVQAPQAMPKAA
jgi:uncharacterized membrane protein HdeD (DUF308 family)